MRSEPDLLTCGSDVACFAEPAMKSELEGRVVFVAEERSGFAAPVAMDGVRVPEIGILEKDLHGGRTLARGQNVAAEDFGSRRSNCASQNHRSIPFGIPSEDGGRGERALRALSRPAGSGVY